jgi:enoyl-CoA hydratase/carnithine racemase
VDVGIPFLPGMVAFVRKAVPEPLFNRMILSGQRMTAEELEAQGVIVKACHDREHLMTEALAFAAAFDKKRGIFRELKQRMHKDLIKALDDEDPVYIEPLSLFVPD